LDYKDFSTKRGASLKKCLKCGSASRRKNGFYAGKQKWQCKDCGHTSCRLEPQGAPIEIIRLALTLVLEGVGFNGTARVLTSFGYKCTENAVIGWVRKYGGKAHALAAATKPTVKYIQIDEMFSYVKKKTTSDTCGWLLMAVRCGKSPREWVIALPKACAN
jgi:transposase-like protein